MPKTEFVDVQYMTANDKRLVLRAWVRFLRHGLRFQDFSKRLYDHLIQHCSFIAHYNKAGFYGYYFDLGNKTVHFLGQFDERNASHNGVPNSAEYHADYWGDGDYADINRAMVAAATPFIPGLIETAKAKQRAADLAEAARLLGKHGMAQHGD